MKPKIAIIGSGPIGLEAGLAAKARGYSVDIYERGEVADSVRRWGHVRMFSPFSLNASREGIAELRRQGREVPLDDAILTGAEYATQYLIPLGNFLGVKAHHTVKAIARDGLLKNQEIGEPARSHAPFRLLIDHGSAESYETADIIFDCSGTFLNPNPLGDGGIPALGEASLRSAIRYGLGETADLSAHADRRTLVVGGGHTANNAIAALAGLQAEHPGTRIAWVSVKPGPLPGTRVPDDPLPERDRLVATVNDLASSGKVAYHSGSMVYSLRREASGIAVTLRGTDRESTEVIETDYIIAATGYRPDPQLASELHVQNCWATDGTYKLAASLFGGSCDSCDCLSMPALGAEKLLHPEPGYYSLGTKSYGRTPDFLIQAGREQMIALLEMMEAGVPVS